MFLQWLGQIHPRIHLRTPRTQERPRNHLDQDRQSLRGLQQNLHGVGKGGVRWGCFRSGPLPHGPVFDHHFRVSLSFAWLCCLPLHGVDTYLADEDWASVELPVAQLFDSTFSFLRRAVFDNPVDGSREETAKRVSYRREGCSCLVGSLTRIPSTCRLAGSRSLKRRRFRLF